MHQDVDMLLSTCVGCLHKHTTNLKKGEHYSKQIPPNKCHLVYIDMIGPVSIKSKKKYLLTVMDAIPMLGKSAREVAKALTISLTGVFGGAPSRS